MREEQFIRNISTSSREPQAFAREGLSASRRTSGTPENLTVLAPHRALLLPHGSSVCRRRAPCKPSSVIGTSVSLRRIDRACYQDRCDAHSDTSDDTYSPTRRDAKRSRREPEEGVHTASRSSITLLARCRRAHGARLGRWRSQKHRWWPSAGVSGGGRDLTIRADDPTSRNNPTRQQPNPTNPTQHETTQLKARF